jgi:hypothetical protein
MALPASRFRRGRFDGLAGTRPLSAEICYGDGDCLVDNNRSVTCMPIPLPNQPYPEPTPADPNPAPVSPPTPPEAPQPEPVGVPPITPGDIPPPGEPVGIPPTTPPEIPVTPTTPQPTA